MFSEISLVKFREISITKFVLTNFAKFDMQQLRAGEQNFVFCTSPKNFLRLHPSLASIPRQCSLSMRINKET